MSQVETKSPAERLRELAVILDDYSVGAGKAIRLIATDIEAREKALREALASTALSLFSYERSYGSGGGIDEAWDIALLLGWNADDDRTDEALEAFLRAQCEAGRELLKEGR